MSNHNSDNLDPSGLQLAQHAIAVASATGAKALTHRDGDVFESEFVRIERVAHGHSSTWRVTDSSIDGITGAVIALGSPGRHKSHAA